MKTKFDFFASQDIDNIELKDIQNERCPRISANDVAMLVHNEADKVVVIDLRNSLEFKKIHVRDSINIPFTSVSLGNVSLDGLNVPNLESKLADKIVVIASNSHENAVLVRNFSTLF